MTARKAALQVQTTAAQEWDAREKQVHALLAKALEVAAGDAVMVTDWLDKSTALEGYGYTVELREELEGLKAAREEFSVHYPVAFPVDLSILEQMKVEEFFRELRAPRAPDPAAPAAGPETPMVQTVEELLNYCRGFKLEEFRQVLLWMDGHGWGELPFGPTDRLKEKVADLLETERELRQREEDLGSQVVGLRGQVADLMRGAKKWEERFELREKICATLEREATEPRVRFVAQHEEIPLEALEWIVRVVNGEEPPFTEDHLETLKLLKEAGEVVGFIRGRLGEFEDKEVRDMVQDLSSRVHPLLQEAGLL